VPSDVGATSRYNFTTKSLFQTTSFPLIPLPLVAAPTPGRSTARACELPCLRRHGVIAGVVCAWGYCGCSVCMGLLRV
jgi:hypothetical protein